MNNELTDFLTRVHENLHEHPFFRAGTGEICEGLALHEARLAIVLFLNSEFRRLTLSQLTFLLRVLNREIVPPGVIVPFRMQLFLREEKKRIFLGVMFRAGQQVAEEIKQRRNRPALSPKTEEEVPPFHP